MGFKKLCSLAQGQTGGQQQGSDWSLLCRIAKEIYAAILPLGCCVSGMPLEPVSCQEQKEDGMCLWEARVSPQDSVERDELWQSPLCSSDSQDGWRNKTLDRKNRDQGRQFQCKAKPEQSAFLPLAQRGIAPPSQESSLDVLWEFCLILIFVRRHIWLDGMASHRQETLQVYPPPVYSKVLQLLC